MQDINNNVLVMGDFNYRLDKTSGINENWLHTLNTFFQDCFANNKANTFKRGNSTSTIDFVYCSNVLYYNNITNQHQQFIRDSWTDHDLLSVELKYDSPTMGSGQWKANPFLAYLNSYRTQLTTHLEILLESYNTTDPEDRVSPQFFWDEFASRLLQKSFS
jgi:hypothetical protein